MPNAIASSVSTPPRSDTRFVDPPGELAVAPADPDAAAALPRLTPSFGSLTLARMLHEGKLEQAVQNNAHWYEALCRIHGIPNERHAGYWMSRHTMPPYMSNLITLAGVAHVEAQQAAIRAMIEIDGKPHFSVKDGFQCLDLAPLGFDILFHATWLYRSPSTPLPDDVRGLEWSVVSSPVELSTWEQTWRGTKANADAQGHAPIFTPDLLRDPDFHFLLGRRGAANVATAALNRSGDVVGISNVFSDVEGVGPLFPGAVRLATKVHPSLPMVGYERGASLVDAQQAGFEPLSGLTVWNRSTR